MLFGQMAEISKDIMQQWFAIEPRMEIKENPWLNSITMSMHQRVFGEQVLQRTIKWPDTWWDAFKDRWFPDWLKDRYPVTWRMYDFDARFLYPSINHPDDKFRSVIYTNVSAKLYEG